MTERHEDREAQAHTFWLAKQAADEIAASENEAEMRGVLEAFEIEPLDALYSLIGSYLEDRTRGAFASDDLDYDDEPF